MHNPLTKIGVFYDGNYFLHVSNFYNYDHPRRARLSIAGLHRFIEAHVGYGEDRPGMAKIVDAHYFRGRLNATEAQQRGSTLYYDRVFDDILTSSSVNTHYSALRTNSSGKRSEKGVDVYFALEAYESAVLRQLDVVVLIASDGDFVPLVRKLQARGCRVVILAWDFEFTTDNGTQMITRTSQDLLDEASHPVMMNHVIDHPRSDLERDLVDDLFVEPKHGGAGNAKAGGKPKGKKEAPAPTVELEEPTEGRVGERMESEIFSLKNGYGFIKYPPNNLFFHHTTLKNIDFKDLYIDDYVEFTLEHNEKGQLVAVDVVLIEDEEE